VDAVVLEQRRRVRVADYRAGGEDRLRNRRACTREAMFTVWPK
jgi:hypothetical protein